MPYCKVTIDADAGAGESAGNSGIKIYYRTYGHGPTKVLLIIGLAGTHDSWGPQIKGLTGTLVPNDAESTEFDDGDYCYEQDNAGAQVCAFDNRGAGRSSVPTKRSQYSTTIMAKDAIALMDHLGWKKAHVFGHSMGGMIASKLASLVPHRVLSLALLNVTGGGSECFPRLDRLTVSIAIRFFMARNPEDRAAVDLDTHYTQEYLDKSVGDSTRRAILYQEYVKGISTSGMQSNYGFQGQVNACWTHKITSRDIESIQNAGFLISVIHGRHDVIAQIRHARRLARKLSAKMVDLHGGHLVSHEKSNEVNEELLELIRASETKLNPQDWANLPENSPGCCGTWVMISSTNLGSIKCFSSMYSVLEGLKFFLLYLFGLFVLLLEYMPRALRWSKPVRVSASLP